jgi:6-phosphogluconolactonase
VSSGFRALLLDVQVRVTTGKSVSTYYLVRKLTVLRAIIKRGLAPTLAIAICLLTSSASASLHASDTPVRMAVTTASEVVVLAGTDVIARASVGGIAAVAAHPTLPLIYVAPESGAKSGRLLTFEITGSGATSGLVLRSEIRLPGIASVHITVARTGEFLVVSHYVNGRASIVRMRANGLPVAKSASLLTVGNGNGSRIHGSAITPDQRGVWLTDTGRDEIISVTVDKQLQPTNRVVTPVSTGSGPRSIALVEWAPTPGRATDLKAGSKLPLPVLVVSNEYANSVTCFALTADGTAGPFVSAALGPVGASRPADIVAARSDAVGTVFVANRGPNEIVSLRVSTIDPGTCSLSVVGRAPSGGIGPRPLVALTTGGWCVGNERSDKVTCGGEPESQLVTSLDRPWGMAILPEKSART